MFRKLSVVGLVIVGIGLLAVINREMDSRHKPDFEAKQEEARIKLEDAKRKEKLLQEADNTASEYTGPTVDVAHILIRASGGPASWAAAKAKIEAVRKRIMAGADFSKVAREVSQDPSVKENGGTFHGLRHGDMIPQFDKVAFSTPVGQVSEPFRTRSGWHILKVLARHQRSSKASAPPAKAPPPPKLNIPAVYKVKFDTTKGSFVVECHKDWAPLGAARFYTAVQQKVYDDCRFFRVVKGFVVQWGIPGNPAVAAKWRTMTIPDEPVKQSNTVGTICFAKGGPNSRTTQVFINLRDNSNLDAMGFAVFGKVVKGMDVVNALNGEYGEAPSQAQQQIQMMGNAFLDKQFPDLDSIKTARIVP